MTQLQEVCEAVVFSAVQSWGGYASNVDIKILLAVQRLNAKRRRLVNTVYCSTDIVG